MLSLILLFPLVGFLINGVWYAVFQAPSGRKKASSVATGIIGSAAIFLSFLVSVLVFAKLFGLPESERVLEQNLFPWIYAGDLKLDFALRVDALSSLFLLVITGIGTLIHIYSIGYMSHDETPGKFFAYLNLFVFAMLILVLGASLPVLFLGWEGVGLCSYLLIGYWYSDIEKAKAGKKAFIANRVGDLGFLVGSFILFYAFGTLDFAQLKLQFVSEGHSAVLPIGISQGMMTAACLALFLGCTGKSAQIPLYVWLPDAMAGPTPVSALIHAATMVTSGIYLLSRLNFMYAVSPTALQVIAIVGGLTAFFAATIAMVQTDIKKVLAYSTVSQLGYMFLAVGVGAAFAGVFHVITHAFFKALLFLGAGSVIHGMHEEQDILKMGGLRTKMPETRMAFWVGWMAICGVIPFAGFFSKDEILWLTFSSEYGSKILWLVGVLTAVMTSFYMSRLYFLTFSGKPRFKEKDDHGHEHAHESPPVMVIPLQILAVLSGIGGLIGIPHLSWIHSWLEPVVPMIGGHGEGGMSAVEVVLMLLNLGIAGGMIYFASKLYQAGDLKAANVLKEKWLKLYQALSDKWYIDELYEAVVIKPIYRISQWAWKVLDVGIIDRTVLGFGRVSLFSGQVARLFHSGSIQGYIFFLVLGLVAAVGYLLYGMV